MNKILLLLIALMLISVLNIASASDISINSTDHFIEINGTKNFIYGMYQICDTYPILAENYPYQPCATFLDWFDNMTYSQSTLNAASSRVTRDAELMALFDSAGIYASATGLDNSPNNLASVRNNSFFWGYKTYPDEPSNGANATIINTRFATALNRTNAIRAADPNHLVTVTNYGYKSASGINVTQIADILEFDPYNLRTNCGSYTYYLYSSCTEVGYHIDDWLFAQEFNLDTQLLQPAGVTSLDEFQMPVFHVYSMQNKTPHTSGGYKYYNPTKEQLRATTYWAITVGYKGILGWTNAFINPRDSFSLNGTGANRTAARIINDIGGEINSQEIKNILVLPSKNHSRFYGLPQDNYISFSKNPTRHVYWTDRYSLSYRYYQNTSSGKDYLIVANKRNQSIDDVVVTISGMSGTKTARTIGQDGAGSSAPNRIITVTNGAFTDSFDAYAGHVYEISSIQSAPIIRSYSNSINNNATNSITINTSESVTFNATANQSITKWTWMVGGISDGNGTDKYHISWLTGGVRDVAVIASNANGNTQTITWAVTVTPSSNTDPKVGYGGVPFSSYNSNFDHTTVNKGDNKVTVGLLADNCDDGTSDWWNTKWTCTKGVLTPTNKINRTEARQNITNEYTDVTLFVKTNESIIGLWDATLRDLKSRNSVYKRYYYGKTSSLNFIQTDEGWTILNSTGTSRIINTDYYNIFDISGKNLNFYSSTDSFASAKAIVRLSATNSTYSSGDYISLSGTNITFDDIRLIEHDRYVGSLKSHYSAGTGNQTESIRTNVTTPANTNYTVSYRQKNTGSWIPIGGTYTGNQTLFISGTKYQDTEINITLFGNGTAFPDIETVEFIREQASASRVNLRYDVNEDGIVDNSDLILASQHFNEDVSIPYPRYDVNMDGLVDINDITIIGKHVGENV